MQLRWFMQVYNVEMKSEMQCMIQDWEKL